MLPMPGDERLVHEQRLEPSPGGVRIRPRNTRSVNRSSSGSGPMPSNGSSSARYSPMRPNFRTSRNRISRPSARAIASRSYGSTGTDAGTTNTCPVILRWIVRNAPSDRSTMICLPRRPTPSMRRPTTPATNAAGSSSRSVRVHETRAPVISGPGPPPSGSRWRRRSRATVSTSGSSGIVGDDRTGAGAGAARDDDASGTIGGS